MIYSNEKSVSVKHKTGWSKRKTIFFFGDRAKQNKLGAKKRQIFFSGGAKQNEVGSKEQLGCPALMLEKKRDYYEFLCLFLTRAKQEEDRGGHGHWQEGRFQWKHTQILLSYLIYVYIFKYAMIHYSKIAQAWIKFQNRLWVRTL